MHLGADVLVPDLAGWRTEKASAASAADYPTVAPDWVCEVLSPSTETIDRVHKPKIYARENVGYAWLLDPPAHTLEILELAQRDWSPLSTFQGAERVRAAPFEAVELALEDIWVVDS